MKITLLTHYYPPEVNAPASRMSEMARTWRDMGHEVTVVTGVPNHPRGQIYPGYRNRWFQRATVEGIEVIRIKTFIAANSGFAKRLLGYLSYFASVLIQRGRIPDSDVVIATSPQFFCGLAGVLLQRRDRPWVLEVRDLWPESIVTVGAMRKGALIRLLERVERWAYNRADAIVAVTDSFVAHIRARAPDAPIAVVKNGVDTESFIEAPEAARAFRAKLGLGDRFVAGYIGTHGMAHGLDTILDAAEILRTREDIVFLTVGDGAERDRLEAEVARRGLPNVVLAGQFPKSDMPAIWSALDAALVLLRKSDTFKSVLPSKMFEAMAMRTPIVLGVEGEAKALLDDSGAGIAIAPEDAEGLAATILQLADGRTQAAALGESGRQFVTEHFSRKSLSEKYLQFLEQVVAPDTQQ